MFVSLRGAQIRRPERMMNTHGNDIFKWAKDKNSKVVVLLNFQFPVILLNSFYPTPK